MAVIQCFPPDSLLDQRTWFGGLLATLFTVLLMWAFARWIFTGRARRSLARSRRGLDAAKLTLGATQDADQGMDQGVGLGVGKADSTSTAAGDATDTPPENPHLYASALHEAAHALYYGVSPEGFPSSLYAEVYQYVSASSAVGAVGHHEGNPQVLSEAFLLWHMRKDVAGTEALWVEFGERYADGRADSELWLECATCYLRAGLGEVFYPEPQTGSLSSSQLAHNRAVLNTLRERCKSDAQQFLTANQEVLLDLAQELMQRLRMEASDLSPFRMRVREPEYSEPRGLS